jgi:hypothetical protein
MEVCEVQTLYSLFAKNARRGAFAVKVRYLEPNYPSYVSIWVSYYSSGLLDLLSRCECIRHLHYLIEQIESDLLILGAGSVLVRA